MTGMDQQITFSTRIGAVDRYNSTTLLKRITATISLFIKCRWMVLFCFCIPFVVTRSSSNVSRVPNTATAFVFMQSRYCSHQQQTKNIASQFLTTATRLQIVRTHSNLFQKSIGNFMLGQTSTILSMSSTSSDNIAVAQQRQEVSDQHVSMSWDTCIHEDVTKKCILPLTSNSYKGSSGRIAIFGGSEKYTGAPYYTAMAALQTGADLVYVLTAAEAAIPIKSYSPELMVASVYTANDCQKLLQNDPTMSSIECTNLINQIVHNIVSNIHNIHCFIVGPGMGRCPIIMKTISQLIQQYIIPRNIPIIMDADALYMLSLPEYCTLLKGYRRAIITPNVMEYKRLMENGITNNLQDVMIVKKGHVDEIILNNTTVYSCTEIGGLKRSGGIGDVLAGTIGTLVAWNQIMYHQRSTTSDTNDKTIHNQEYNMSLSSLPLTIWTALCFAKRATNVAYNQKHRSMTAPDILNVLGTTINSMLSPSNDE